MKSVSPSPVAPDSRILLDTNVLVRLVDIACPQNLLVSNLLARLLAEGRQVFLAPQNLIEFWNVATRPVAVNGMGRSVSETSILLNYFQTTFRLLPDSPIVFAEWERMVKSHEITGKQVHDCRLVAFMLVHQITHLVTFNAAHFRRFESSEPIVVVEPGNLVTAI